MNLWQRLRQPPWRTLVPGVALLLLLPLAYRLWNPGLTVTDGRHDRHQNAIWLQHGWLGDDHWFKENKREARLPEFGTLPAGYQGIALYSEWEMDASEWQFFRRNYLKQ
jgi:hypothetical protein